MNEVNLDQLKEFIMSANMPHATGSASIKNESDGSRTIEYSEDDYRLHDNFFGGEPYGGRLVVFYKDQPVFIEVYYGTVDRPTDELYQFLREALQHPDKESPFRGPKLYKSGNLIYKSMTAGDVKNHTVNEYIYDNDAEIYRATFIGGLVDQNAKGAM